MASKKIDDPKRMVFKSGQYGHDYEHLISAMSAKELHYVNTHREDLARENHESIDIENGIRITPNIFSFFKGGHKTNHIDEFEEIGMDREALIAMQKKGVPFEEIDKTRKLNPDMSFSQMRSNFDKTGTLDGLGKTAYAFEIRRDQHFETKVADVLKGQPNAEEIADLKYMLVLGKIEAGTIPPNIAIDKSKPAPETKKQQAEAQMPFSPAEPNDLGGMTREQAFPADKSRISIENHAVGEENLGNMKIPMIPSDAEWLNTLQQIKVNNGLDL